MGQRVIIRDNVATVIQTGPIGPAGPSGSNDPKTQAVNFLVQPPVVFADGQDINTMLAAALWCQVGMLVAVVGFGPADGIYEGRSPSGSLGHPEQWLPVVRLRGLDDFKVVVSSSKAKTNLDGLEFGPWVTSREDNDTTWSPATKIGSGGVTGVGFVTRYEETIGEGEDAVTYKVADVGGDNKEFYFVPTSPGDKVLLRPPSSPDSTTAHSFNVQLSNTDKSVRFYVQMPIFGDAPTEVSGPLWGTSDGQGNLTAGFICLPGALLGLEDDIWFPRPGGTTTSILPRAGQAYATPTAVVDPGTDPDGTVSMEKYFSNVATMTVDADGFTFIEVKVSNIFGGRPFRLAFKNASSLTSVRITDDVGGSVDFDPDALDLRVGTSVIGTIQVVATSPTSRTIVYDPIGGTNAGVVDTTHYKLVLPTIFNNWMGAVSGEVVVPATTGYNGFAVADGDSVNLVFNALSPGEQAIIKVRVHNGYGGTVGGTIAVSVFGVPNDRMSSVDVGAARDFELRVWRDYDGNYHAISSYGTATQPEDF